MTLQSVCALCGKQVAFEDAFGLTLFPSDDPDGFQQWWVHPMCAKRAFADQVLVGLREEVAEPMGLEPRAAVDLDPEEWRAAVRSKPTPFAAYILKNDDGVLVVDSTATGKRYGISFDEEDGYEFVHVTELEAE